MANKDQIQVADLAGALRELEAIAGRIESGELGVEAGLDAYRRGMQLVQHCRQVLQQAERTVASLSAPAQVGLRMQSSAA